MSHQSSIEEMNLVYKFNCEQRIVNITIYSA